MKVKILVSMAGSVTNYKPKDIVDVDDKIAKRMIDAKFAEKVVESKAKKSKG